MSYKKYYLLSSLVLAFIFMVFTNARCPFAQAETPPTRKLTPTEKVTVDIYDKVSPAVVNITTAAMSFDAYFNPVPRKGSASGFIINPNGIVVTNNHVVEGFQVVAVGLQNGKSYKAKIIGTDPTSDIAVLKIEDTKAFPSVNLGTSNDLFVGQEIYAIGNPFGLSSTLSTGVISSLNRTIEAPDKHLMDGIIQTDAAINPGNSGGPLLDSAGKVIGINTAIFSPSGVSAGISFSVPIDKVKHVVSDIQQYGYVIRPYLGIVFGFELNPYIAARLNIPVERGLQVSMTQPGSPAAIAGILGGVQPLAIGGRVIMLGGDIVTKADDKRVTNTAQFQNILENKKTTDKLVLTVVRQGKEVPITVQLMERPANIVPPNPTLPESGVPSYSQSTEP